MNIQFDAENRLIRINPFYFTIVDATEGNDYIDVDSIPSDMPQDVWISLAKSKAKIVGTNDMSAGYDFSADPRNFLIIAGDGIYSEKINLDQSTSSATEVANLINTRLQQNRFEQNIEAIVVDTKFIALQQKDPYWGETFSFVLDYGSPDALTILGINPGTYVGVSDIYESSSWSGTRIYLTTTLTMTYQTGVYGAGYYKEINVQDIYDASRDWDDSDVGISHPEPMSASGYFPLGGGAYTDKIFVLKNGWKIMPHSGNYILTFIGTTITDDGTSRIRLPRAGTVSVIFQVSSQGIISETPVQNVINEIKKHDQKMTALKFID